MAVGCASHIEPPHSEALYLWVPDSREKQEEGHCFRARAFARVHACAKVHARALTSLSAYRLRLVQLGWSFSNDFSGNQPGLALYSEKSRSDQNDKQ